MIVCPAPPCPLGAAAKSRDQFPGDANSENRKEKARLERRGEEWKDIERGHWSRADGTGGEKTNVLWAEVERSFMCTWQWGAGTWQIKGFKTALGARKLGGEERCYEKH